MVYMNRGFPQPRFKQNFVELRLYRALKECYAPFFSSHALQNLAKPLPIPTTLLFLTLTQPSCPDKPSASVLCAGQQTLRLL